MALKNGRYYQRSIRVKGKVTTRYIGAGEFGALMYACDLDLAEQERQLRQESRERLEREQAEFDVERARGKATTAIIATALHGVGYARPHRKSWRKRPMTTEVKPAMPVPTAAELKDLIAKCRTNEPGARAKLMDLAESHPQPVIEATGADLVELCFISLANLLNSEKRFAKREGLLAKLRLIVSDLVGKSRSPVKRMLAESVAFAWCEYWIVSLLPAVHDPMKTSPIYLRRQNAAQRRFMSALKTFAQVTALEGKVSGNIFVNLFGDEPAAEQPQDLCIDGNEA
jgi:hypothetical protein